MPNRLAEETSPYLLQHANNPVDWYAWGEEALTKAQEEDKLLLVSIGYAACHWCHVMEHESFEDPEVARFMNEYFVNIKVDREERPDIDKIYMDAVQLMTGRGGWPLNAIALPDGRPIFGGTYFPKSQWLQMLSQIVNLYKKSPQRALKSAQSIAEYLQKSGVERAESNLDISHTHLLRMLEQWMGQIDFQWGGRKVSSNKFPLPANNLFLLQAAFLTGLDKVQEAVDVTLEKMAYGGIYDHLGGGFARYSVDQYWKVPHFEKMLYDNGQMVSLYAEAWQQNPRPLYKKVVYETLRFVERELMSPEGGFYASLDADSEGVEGKYYVWTHEEIEKIMGRNTKLFADYFNIHPFGNWEDTNVLFVLESEEEFARKWNLDEKEFKRMISEGKHWLFEARQPRPSPGLDDKILTSWNALMLKGFIDAYRVFGEYIFLQLALQNANFLRNNLADGGKLYRNYKEGKRTINAFLDDYAFLIDAYLALYQITFEEEWLEQAQLHLEYVHDHFYDRETGMYFYTSDEDEVLVTRKMEIQDDVIPSSNAALAHALYSLGLLMHRQDYLDRSRQMLANVQDTLRDHPAWHARWAQLALREIFPHYEVAITGPNALNFRMELDQTYYPNRIFAGAENSSPLPILQGRFAPETTVYVCEENTCQLPVHTVAEAIEQMKSQ